MVCTVLAGLKWDHCTHLTWNLGHRMKWDHYKHPLSCHFVLCWGWPFLIRFYLWVSIWTPKRSVCLRFVQFCLDRTSETIAGILLENWVTDWSETTTSTPYHITVCFVGWCFLIRPSPRVPRYPPTNHRGIWLEVLLVVSLHLVTQISSKMRAMVSLVLSRQNCTNHRHTDPLGAHMDTHRHDLMRKDHPNKAQSDMIRGACSGLTSSCDPDFK